MSQSTVFLNPKIFLITCSVELWGVSWKKSFASIIPYINSILHVRYYILFFVPGFLLSDCFPHNVQCYTIANILKVILISLCSLLKEIRGRFIDGVVLWTLDFHLCLWLLKLLRLEMTVQLGTFFPRLWLSNDYVAFWWKMIDFGNDSPIIPWRSAVSGKLDIWINLWKDLTFFFLIQRWMDWTAIKLRTLTPLTHLNGFL